MRLLVAESDRMMGRWELRDNPLKRNQMPGSRFFMRRARMCFLFEGLEKALFLWLTDRRPEELADQQYLRLPIIFMEDGIEIKWGRIRWDLNTFRK